MKYCKEPLLLPGGETGALQAVHNYDKRYPPL